MQTPKKRLDIIMVQKGLALSREKAKHNILAGNVYVNNRIADKPGLFVHENDDIQLKGEAVPFVSRGGLKLEKAIKEFNVPVEGRVYIDIGASTGGFTQCLLQHGAKKVYALDVGHNQLSDILRNDPRVVSMEGVNIRSVTAGFLPESPQGATIDVSFISLKLVLPVVKDLLVSNSPIVALVKPQFEAGRDNVGKRGLVRDPSVHRSILVDILSFCRNAGLAFMGLSYSPILGLEGNIEFLLYLCSSGMTASSASLLDIIDTTVNAAHANLK
jgi:23S rRNA (cytidine1920-2'-O)/16S rRNA (cytidine1409-2'-O)-methyltransferase